jgi:catechol 2,3-dioxygenase-like lactoylglutathione lyase family enzyme
MRINLASVLVDDQDKALRFYTEVLGFVKKTEIPLGDARPPIRTTFTRGGLSYSF